MAASSSTPPGKRDWAAYRSTISFLFWVCLSVAALVALIFWPDHGDTTDSHPPDETVRVVEESVIAIKPGSKIEQKVTLAKASPQLIESPLLVVTGSIAARLAPGKDSPDARWDFTSAEPATSYADWLKARAEERFTAEQLATIRKLAEARVAYQETVEKRAIEERKIGTVSEKDLAQAKADLLQARLQARKDSFEAEAAAKNAVRTRTTLERQLFQAGIDPRLLESTSLRLSLAALLPAGRLVNRLFSFPVVVAEVPETKLYLVKVGQGCTTQFFAYPQQIFAGRVSSLAPSVSRERRTLRVFFELEDPHQQLKPGMFAEVSLGTDPRSVLFVPSDALIHVGRSDYVLVKAEADHWRVVEVTAGETRGAQTEILSGLAAESVVIGAGAILLKPVVVQALSKK